MGYNSSLEKQFTNEFLNILKKEYKLKTLQYKNCTGTLSDLKNSTDFKVKIDNKEINVGFRIRRGEYQCYQDCTIRAKTKYNQKTEIDKIQENDVCMFYAWLDKTQSCIEHYVFYEINDELRRLLKTKTIIQNYDGRYIKKDGQYVYTEYTGFVTLSIEEIEKANAIICSNKI